MEGQMELFHNYVLYIQRNQNKHNYIQKLPTKPMLVFVSQSSHLNTVVRLVKTIKICNYKIITFQEKKIVETGYMTATCVVIAILD